MKPFYRIVVVLILCLLSVSVSGQVVDTDIYPSEEELYEAYLTGRIDYQTYLNLKEIFEIGISSTDWYLLDEIPNITRFFKTEPDTTNMLETEQAEPFIAESPYRLDGRLTGKIRWKRYQKLEYEGVTKNRFYLDTQINSEWSVKIDGGEDYDGFRKYFYRSISYKGSSGPVRKLIVGNYTARFGLGTVVGYRGKILEKDELALDETLLSPDYGGFNGLYLEGGPANNPVRWLFHYDQNRTYRIKTTALNIKRLYGSYSFEGTILGSILNNRISKDDYKYYQFGAHFGYRIPNYEAACEIVFPKGFSLNDNRAALFESVYRGNNLNLKVSAWSYGRDYVNLFGGGRSGALYRTVSIEDIELEYSDRRNNQQGLLIKTRTGLTDISNIDMTFSVYGSSFSDRYAEFRTSLGYSPGVNSEMRFYYELLKKEKMTGISEDNIVKAEYNFRKPGFSLRSYVGYRFRKDGVEYLSHFWRAKLKNRLFRELEIWLNFGRIDMKKPAIDYFYGYIKEQIDLTGGVFLGVKYIYRYNRDYSKPEETTLYLETTAVW